MSRELRAFREANEPAKKKALSADDRFTNVTNIWKFLVARKKGKKEKQREIALEKFLKWFKGEEESRSGRREEGKVVEEEVGARGLRGDDFLSRKSRSNWTIVQSTGS